MKSGAQDAIEKSKFIFKRGRILMKKKLVSLLLVLSVIFSIVPLGSISASAAVNVTTNKYYTIKNVGGNRYLNVYYNSSRNNTNINLWAWDGTSGEDFKFVKNGSGYLLIPRCATGRAVNIYGDTAKSGSNVCTWSTTKHSTQTWIPEYVASKKGYILRSAYTKNLVLTASGNKNGSNVCVKTYNGSSYQIWTCSALKEIVTPAPTTKPTTNPTPVKPASTLTISPTAYPSGTLMQGNYYNLKGTVKSNYNLKSVTGQIRDVSGNVKYSATVKPNKTSYTIGGTNEKIDTSLKFNGLAPGKYSLKYMAEDTYGKKIEWSKTFTIAQIKYIEPSISGLKLSNCGGSENNSIYGKAGDQTGKEWAITGWFSTWYVEEINSYVRWDCVLRHPDPRVQSKLVELSKKAARNDNIGYDWPTRDTYRNQLFKAGYDPSKITVRCNTDCSAGAIANVRATGYLLGIKKLQNLTCTYTGNMRSAMQKAGFQVLTGAKYTSSNRYLQPGDIMLNDIYHTAVVVD